MRKLIASLSLVLTIGINAETSNNLVTDPYVEFLDSTYDYPNIHNHGTWTQDPYIYTGNSNYEHSAVAEYDINLDTLTFEITQANYGYTYKSNATGLGAIAIALIDADGNMIDDAVHEFDITTINEWIDVDKIYNDMDNLSQAKELWLGVGGISDRNGTDDIMITDIYLTYEYQEIPLDIITDTSISLALDDSLYMELPSISYDFPALEPIEMPTTTPEIQAPVVQQPPAPAPIPANTPSPAPTPQTSAPTKTTQTKTKEVKKNETKTTSAPQGFNEYRTTQLVENTTGSSNVFAIGNDSNFGQSNGFFGSSGMDFASYTGLDLIETIQLTEPSFYDEPDFYESEINLTDNIELNNIDFYKGTNWYGSNIKFY